MINSSYHPVIGKLSAGNILMKTKISTQESIQGTTQGSTQGGCLCGKVRYEVAGPFADADHCHCSMCRRQHGAAFSTYAAFTPGNFEWISGEAYIKTYQTPGGGGWCFCSECGSSLAGTDNGRITSVTLGTVDGDPGIRPQFHIFVGSGAQWHEINDDLPQFEQRPADTSRRSSEWHSPGRAKRAIPKVISINRAMDSLRFVGDRKPTSGEEEMEGAFAELSAYRDGAIFLGHYAGNSAWERHPGGDEIVYVLQGETTLFILDQEGEAPHDLKSGELMIVPQNTWHRFETPQGMKVMTVTPYPEEHSVEPPQA